MAAPSRAARILGVVALLMAARPVATEKSVFARLHPGTPHSEVAKFGTKVSLGTYEGKLTYWLSGEMELAGVGAIAAVQQGSCAEALASVRRYLEQDFGSPRSLPPHRPVQSNGLNKQCHDWRLKGAWLQACCLEIPNKQGRLMSKHVMVVYRINGRNTPVTPVIEGLPLGIF